ncbi:hypothetical protein [Streptomyces sp. NPDC023588]|uniref:hypothetical protein n=1 Tax=Streptomyces sp. NPDC023588 TaxID=3154907 RepID=UPI00340DE6F8
MTSSHLPDRSGGTAARERGPVTGRLGVSAMVHEAFGYRTPFGERRVPWPVVACLIEEEALRKRTATTALPGLLSVLQDATDFLVDSQSIISAYFRHDVAARAYLLEEFIGEGNMVGGHVEPQISTPHPFPIGENVVPTQDSLIGSQHIINGSHEGQDLVAAVKVFKED